jgi:hypothetical protein
MAQARAALGAVDVAAQVEAADGAMARAAG